MRRKELWQQRQAIDTATPETNGKQYKYLYRRMLDEDVIRKAYKKLRKGKTKRAEIKVIDADLDNEVAAMRRMIENTKPPGVPVEHPELAYRPRKRTPKIITEKGKRRKIYMPEIHEQWLHHIIVLILEPIITATAYPFSCGSFPKRGAHYGKKQVERWIRSGEGIRYFAKLDIRHFYDNISHRVLMRELRVRIKDDWFLYIIQLCLTGFKKGVPLGFYISQWLANYLLEPLDKFIIETLGLKRTMRYMDDISIFGAAKKGLHQAVQAIRIFLGRRFRLRLKRNFQVCKFDFTTKKGKRIGRPLDYMGFLFFREKTLIRKSIMLAATRLASQLHRAKEAGRGYFSTHIKAMLSYMGWFDCSDTYGCYEEHIKPFVKIGRLKKIVSKLDRREKRNETVADRAMRGGTPGLAGCGA